MHGLHIWIGAQVFRAIFYHSSRRKNPRKGFLFNTNPRIGFVVFELNIVFRQILFYQVILQQQRIQFGVHNDIFQSCYLTNKNSRFRAIMIFYKVRFNSVFDVFSLANINYSLVFVEILINARLIG